MASGSFKFQAADLIASFRNYTELFAFVSSTSEQDLLLTPQWIYDILQEFVYQFQGFCQMRSSVRNEKDVTAISANSDVWGVGAVYGVLRSLILAGASAKKNSTKQQFGYFASIELSRLECLLGDHSAALSAVSALRLLDREEPFHAVLSAHTNVFYHVGVSLLMLRRHADTIGVLGEVLLHVSRVLRPGAASLRTGTQTTLQKIMDKIIALLAIAMALSPASRVDDQVRELVESKLGDKLRRMQQGDANTFEDCFEAACPKFVSPLVPAELPSPSNLCQEAVRMQVAVFVSEALQQARLLKLRSYTRMYSSIELAKLARFNESSEAEFVSQLVAYKHRSMQSRRTTTCGETVDAAGAQTSESLYYIDAGALLIEAAPGGLDKSRAAERYFVAGIRKHAEITADLKRSAAKCGL